MGNIYFVQSGDDGAIKIGTTQTSDRVRNLQTGNPEPLKVLRTIRDVPNGLELILHRVFADLRVRGEWFKPDERLLSFVAADDWEAWLKERGSTAAGRAADDPTEQITFRLDRKLLAAVKRKARRVAYEEDRDYSHTDLIRELLEREFTSDAD